MRFLPILFSLALFGAAFLAFSIQPILGKMLLPLVGGAPAGWITALAFFQLALLAGYGVSYLLGRLNIKWHVGGLVVLYLLGFTYLPPVLENIADNAQGPALSVAVIRMLFHAIFMPYMALTATTSALQRLFANTRHPTARDPYYLFVASNIGSFAGLLAYPLVLELFYGLHAQADLWRWIYAGVTGLIVACGIVALRWRGIADVSSIAPGSPAVPLWQVGRWLVLAFIPCSLSMGVTTLITTNVAAVPLFWIIPLGLYLLTFVFAFARKPFLSLKKLASWQVNVVGFLLCIMALGLGFTPYGDIVTFSVIVFLLLEVFFVIALFCHQMLAAARPGADRLTLFYFIVALGGGLAGILHAFVLPFILKQIIEFPVVVLLSLLVHPAFWQADDTARFAKYNRVYLGCALVSAIAVIVLTMTQGRMNGSLAYVVLAALFLVPFLMISSRPHLLLAVGSVILLVGIFLPTTTPIVAGRNFFGAWSVQELDTAKVNIRYFSHGNTRHGMFVDDGTDQMKYNSSYYARIGPLHNVMAAAHARTVGVIGLGVGQLACFDPQLRTDFYEIDADVVQIANTYFPYLKDCPPRRIIIGDGRIELDKTDNLYDVILLDAFTSDGIPLHILTREAVAMYKRHLAPQGIIVFHISNIFFDLAPPIAAVASAENLSAYTILHRPDATQYPYVSMSKWLALPVSADTGNSLAASGWQLVVPASTVWTDDYSSMMRAVNFNGLH